MTKPPRKQLKKKRHDLDLDQMKVTWTNFVDISGKDPEIDR